MNSFKIDVFIGVFPKILKYFPATLKITLLSFIIAIILGFGVAIIRQNKIKYLYPISNVYLSFFRGTPFIAQLFLFYYGFAQFSNIIRTMSQFTSMAVVLSLNFSAYAAENIRAAINSVDKGQYEACISIGMTPFQAYKRIIIPQATRVAIPGLSNTFVNLFKSTALGFSIGLKDMLAGATMEINLNYRYLECYLAVIIIYWIIISILSYFQHRLEEKMSVAY